MNILQSLAVFSTLLQIIGDIIVQSAPIQGSDYDPPSPNNCNRAGYNYHQCRNGRCIPLAFVCDGDNDCRDEGGDYDRGDLRYSSDELNCPERNTVQPSTTTTSRTTTTKSPCAANTHQCRNGRCIPTAFLCDGDNDCRDEGGDYDRGDLRYPSDELNCPKLKTTTTTTTTGSTPTTRSKSCKTNEYECTNGRCIPIAYLCDGDNDCNDNNPSKPDASSDEQNCPKPKSCIGDQFMCPSEFPPFCISTTDVCDGAPDCRGGGADEQNCAKPETCKSNYFACSVVDRPPFCVPNLWRCDGEPDCKDGSDEQNCTNSTTTTARTRSTETTTTRSTSCYAHQHECRNGRCIPVIYLCDGDNDCNDNDPNDPYASSDEQNCPKPNSCYDDEYMCPSEFPPFCISSTYVCDGDRNCKNGGADEQNCTRPETCKPEYFACSAGGPPFCVPNLWRCDGDKDCKDGSDELKENCIPDSCNDDEFKCPSNMPPFCVPSRYVCDGKPDCKGGGADEQNCTKYATTTAPTTTTTPATTTTPTTTTALATTTTTTTTILACDLATHHKCLNGRCIPLSFRCDNYNHCEDQRPGLLPSDEVNCPICNPNHALFECGRCIAVMYKCDGNVDCPDANDERNCESTTTTATTETMRRTTDVDTTTTTTTATTTSTPTTTTTTRTSTPTTTTTPKSTPTTTTTPTTPTTTTTPTTPTTTTTPKSTPTTTTTTTTTSTPTTTTTPTTPTTTPTTTTTTRIACDVDTEHECRDGRCMPISFRCDGYNHCQDQNQALTGLLPSDESNCPCDPNSKAYKCAECIPPDWLCNGIVDCPDNSDEQACANATTTTTTPTITTTTTTRNNTMCDPTTQHMCHNGRCIHKSYMCDGHNDCRDETSSNGWISSDEQQCFTKSWLCESYGLFACADRQSPICIPKHWRCDGETDCQDASDELNCELDRSVKNQTELVPILTRCNPITQHTCRNGKCVMKHQVCDGNNDCQDGIGENGTCSDEQNCTTRNSPLFVFCRTCLLKLNNFYDHIRFV